MEATNPAATTEGTPSVAPVSEVAKEPAVSTTQTQEVTDGVDWTDESLFKDIPEDTRELAKLYGEKVFKRAYTKKTQTLAEERKAYQEKLDSLTKEKEALVNDVMETIKNPDLYKQYRQRYGLEDVSTVSKAPSGKKFDLATLDPNNLPEDLTVGDFVGMIKDLEHRLTNTAVSKAKGIVDQAAANQAYGVALKNARNDSFFKKYEEEIINIATNHKDIRGLWNPQDFNDYDVLMAAKEKFQNKLKEDLDEAKQQTLIQELEKKKTSTLAPQKAVQTTTETQVSNRTPGRVDASSVLASVKAKRPDLF